LAVFGAVGLGRFGYSVILPSMQEGLGINSAAAGALASWNLGGYLPMAVISGVLAHRFGTRAVVGLGSLLAAAGMLLTGITDDLTLAYVSRLLTGLGSGAVMVPSVALMSAWFSSGQRGMASGIAASGPALAMVIAGPVVPAIIAGGDSNAWRMAWYLFAGLTCFAGIVTLLAQRNRPRRPMEESIAGSLPDGGRAAGQLSADLGRVLRSRFAWHLGFTYMTLGFAYMIYITFFQKRLTVDVGLSSESAGRLFLLVGVVSLFSGWLWGAISDRAGRGKALTSAALLQAVAAALFAWWPTTPGILISVVFCGLTAISIPGIIGAACGDKFGARLASTSLGFVTLFMGVGQVVGPYLAGYMADVFGTLKYSYVLAAGVFCVGTLLSAMLRDRSVCPESGRGGSDEQP